MSPEVRLLLFMANRPERARAILEAIDRALATRLHGHYQVEVIDVIADPARAAAEQVIMTPTLVIKFPAPERRLIGDLTDTERLCLLLDFTEGDPPPSV